MTVLMASPALAENIGVSMAKFDDNFLTVLRNGMQDYATGKDGVNLQVEDAQNDVSKQLSQIQNFIAQGVDAIIVNPVDTDATPAMTKLAVAAGVPLVYQPHAFRQSAAGQSRSSVRMKSIPARSKCRKSARSWAARATSWC